MTTRRIRWGPFCGRDTHTRARTTCVDADADDGGDRLPHGVIGRVWARPHRADLTLGVSGGRYGRRRRRRRNSRPLRGGRRAAGACNGRPSWSKCASRSATSRPSTAYACWRWGGWWLATRSMAWAHLSARSVPPPTHPPLEGRVKARGDDGGLPAHGATPRARHARAWNCVF